MRDTKVRKVGERKSESEVWKGKSGQDIEVRSGKRGKGKREMMRKNKREGKASR